jgi:hypothetical protein
MVRIREEILEPLRSIGKTYVIGGLIRDIAMYGLEDRPESDLDLVVRCTPGRLAEFAERCGGVQNRFGGFAVKKRAYRVDFWAFTQTWAKTAGHVSLKAPEDLTRTTFFDWDAVVYGIEEHELWAADKYLDRLHSGVLDIGLEPNPSKLGTLVRALRRVMMWDARPSALLRKFLDRELRTFEWSDILSAEKGAFYSVYLPEFDSRESFIDAVLKHSSFENRSFDRRRQTKFGVIEEAGKSLKPPRLHAGYNVSVVPKKTKRSKTEHVGDLFAK